MVKVCRPCCCDSICGWHNNYPLHTVVVHCDSNRIESSQGEWQSCDVVECHCGEWDCVRLWWYGHEQNSCWMRVWLASLADCTSLDVSHNELAHPWPPEVALYKGCCFANPRMSGRWEFMIQGYNALSQVLVHWNVDPVLVPYEGPISLPILW